VTMPHNPILNNPYLEPQYHYHTNENGELDYDVPLRGRRVFVPDISVIPGKQGQQGSLYEINELAADYASHPVNIIRKEVGAWRDEGYPNTTRVTRELLDFWFRNPEREAMRQLFFAQREAIETAIWLNEIATRANAGQAMLDVLRKEQKAVSADSAHHLPRVAFKMATGTGKTVVMAALIVYHLCNRREYRQDTRFADYFLVVAPGITIKDRLGVLFVDQKSPHKNQREDYYAQRDLVPQKLAPHLDQLNARLVITNYHAFEPRTLQGNKKSPLDGKIIGYDDNGKPVKQEAKEDPAQMVKRVLGGFKPNSRLLILNDEAHHCYLPRQKGKTQDTEADENAKAAVWFSGLTEIAKKFKLAQVYDLSATPYYLQGSGYTPYSLFGWVVSDFGLIEAIESGLVKIPFLPEGDTTHELDMPVLKNLYDHVKDKLPKKGQRKQKKEAKAEGKTLTETAPDIPPLVKTALDQFYQHYYDYCQLKRDKGEEKISLFTRPPVFIAVCNNTSVSKELYKFIAGYETSDAALPGHYDLFSNYDTYGKLKRKAPTLLIDSEALEDADQINDDFKKIFAAEIDEFKRDYARLKGQGAAENISDAEILREVVNTVGEPGRLGGHVRCVVSVSMLTEGWDCGTVTHIMGLRAFGSQLLCEQVAGRALRRMSYVLQPYHAQSGELIDEKNVYRYKPENITWKFPPEYAHIIGVPFRMFKGGETSPPVQQDYTHIRALPERQADFEITFPNVDGYRVEYADDELLYDFSAVENYEIDGTKLPLSTTMGSAFLADTEKLKVAQVLEKRRQEIVYLLTQALLQYHFCDHDGNRKFQQFPKLKEIVEYWYDHKLLLLNIQDEKYKKLVYFDNPKAVADHIARGINPHINQSAFIKPSINRANPVGSSKYVNGNTVKDVYPTYKSQVNFTVMDSGWEGHAAKDMDELAEVEAYVKNEFLGFTIPYVKDGKDRLYYPDFIARVRKPNGDTVNLVIEITGMNKDKAEKKWYVENRWLPAVNNLDGERWEFLEIANDNRNLKNQLIEKIKNIKNI
jgi:type III restriction enzyme